MFLELLIKFPVAIALLFVAFRTMGMKEIAQATPVDFAFAVLTVSIVWDLSLSPEYNMWHIIVILLVLGAIIYILDLVTIKSKRVQKILMGEPKKVIIDGVVNKEILNSERLSMCELESRMRLAGIFDLQEVELAYIEINGEVSFKKKELD